MKNLKTRVDSIFVLINLAGKRIRELVSGSPKLIETESNDFIGIALEEISQGKISPGKKEDISHEAFSDNVQKSEEVTKEKKDELKKREVTEKENE